MHLACRELLRLRSGIGGDGMGVWCGAYQCAGGVDACVADGGVIEPFWLGEAEEAVAGDVHC